MAINSQASNILPLNDHDLLIKLDTKLDGLITNMASFQNDVVVRMVKAETRLDQIDIYHAGIPLKSYDDIYQWAVRIRSNLTFVLALAGTVTAVLGGFISALLTKWFNI